MRRVLLPIVVFALALSARSLAAEQTFKVIVHPDNPLTSIDGDFLRDAYLKKTREWKGDGTIRPVDLSTKFPVRAKFVRDILKKTPNQLKNYWNQQIFSGKGVPPPEAESASAVISYVLKNPGAVGYIPANVDPGGAKVIPVK
jgi:ABC-type phosphate transport system substrate-binding protein